MSMSQNVSLPQIFLVGVGYCRESRSLAHVNSWDDTIESCLDRHDCIARCYAFRSCVAVAWAATPKSDHSQCRELGKPRCINYITYSGQLAGGTDSHAREYECLSRYAPLPVAPSLPPMPSPPRPPVRPPPAPVVRAPADITGIVSLAVCVLLLYLVLEAVRPMPLSREQEAAIRDVFRTFDKDRSGTMDAKEVSRALEAMGLDLSRQEAKGVLMQLDKDGSGALSFSEFRTLMHSACGGLRGLPSLRKNLQRLKTGLV
mmetsp:Transcript_2424/g.7773  ORF Transcript_2424/g.7773 Transcript_2424/m.7773 type:complete len:259 (+) Transcript_2424:41-817(+)